MNSIVLSGTRTLVPSRTRSTCYRGRKSELTLCCAKIFRARNFTNLESFGFLLTDLRLLTANVSRNALWPCRPVNGSPQPVCPNRGIVFDAPATARPLARPTNLSQQCGAVR